ncbi:MAG: hypothetical protein O2954_00005, partial [bacterium]|nr:hypothetical protein [bacterium]
MERLKFKTGYLVWLVVWMTVLCGAPVWGDELEVTLEAERAALDSLKTKLEADQKKLEATRGREQSVSADLERQEREIVGLRGELRRQERQERGLAERLGRTRQNLTRVESQLETRQQGMAERIREMYKLGRRGRLQILFSADSF